MQEDLAPLRRAKELLATETPVDDIIVELRTLFGLDHVDAMAAIAAVMLLCERGIDVPAERPVWRR